MFVYSKCTDAVLANPSSIHVRAYAVIYCPPHFPHAQDAARVVFDPATLGLRNLLYFAFYTTLYNRAQSYVTPLLQQWSVGSLNWVVMRNGRKRAQPILLAMSVAVLAVGHSWLLALDYLIHLSATSHS